MAGESPSVVLYDSNGNALAVQNSTAIPVSTPALLVAGSDGTNSHYLLMDGYARTIVAGAGVSGIPAGGVLTIQGIVGGTTVPVSGTVTANIGTTGGLALDTTVSALQVAQGSTTSGQKGGLVLGAVTTAAPAYTTGQTDPLSLTTTGLLRVDGSGVTQPVSGTVTANAGTGNFNVIGTGSAGTPTTGVVTVQGIAGGTAIPISGTVTFTKSSTGTLTSVAAAVTSTSLLASNANRLGATFYNDGGSVMYIGLSATAVSTSAFSIKLLPNSYYDLPIDYTGQVNGIWTSAVGNARVTELIP